MQKFGPPPFAPRRTFVATSRVSLTLAALAIVGAALSACGSSDGGSGSGASQAVKELEGKAGAPIAIKGFVRYALGEGIEKAVDDFAAEVAAAAKG